MTVLPWFYVFVGEQCEIFQKKIHEDIYLCLFKEYQLNVNCRTDLIENWCVEIPDLGAISLGKNRIVAANIVIKYV